MVVGRRRVNAIAKNPRGWGSAIRRVIVALASGYLVLGGFWFLARGFPSSAVVAFGLGAFGIISLLLPLMLRGRMRRPEFHDSIQLSVDPATAFRWAGETLGRVVDNSEVQSDPERLTVWIDVPSSWRSWGERVTVVVVATPTGTQASVVSQCARPQLMDSGRNQANVQAVLDALDDRERGPDLGPDP